jgi:hypothetical protein
VAVAAKFEPTRKTKPIAVADGFTVAYSNSATHAHSESQYHWHVGL